MSDYLLQHPSLFFGLSFLSLFFFYYNPHLYLIPILYMIFSSCFELFKESSWGKFLEDLSLEGYLESSCTFCANGGIEKRKKKKTEINHRKKKENKREINMIMWVCAMEFMWNPIGEEGCAMKGLSARNLSVTRVSVEIL